MSEIVYELILDKLDEEKLKELEELLKELEEKGNDVKGSILFI